jgi:hypothetical protein
MASTANSAIPPSGERERGALPSLRRARCGFIGFIGSCMLRLLSLGAGEGRAGGPAPEKSGGSRRRAPGRSSRQRVVGRRAPTRRRGAMTTLACAPRRSESPTPLRGVRSIPWTFAITFHLSGKSSDCPGLVQPDVPASGASSNG